MKTMPKHPKLQKHIKDAIHVAEDVGGALGRFQQEQREHNISPALVITDENIRQGMVQAIVKDMMK
jgi:hypothetical protein